MESERKTGWIILEYFSYLCKNTASYKKGLTGLLSGRYNHLRNLLLAGCCSLGMGLSAYAQRQSKPVTLYQNKVKNLQEQYHFIEPEIVDHVVNLLHAQVTNPVPPANPVVEKIAAGDKNLAARLYDQRNLERLILAARGLSWL